MVQKIGQRVDARSIKTSQRSFRGNVAIDIFTEQEIFLHDILILHSQERVEIVPLGNPDGVLIPL